MKCPQCDSKIKYNCHGFTKSKSIEDSIEELKRENNNLKEKIKILQQDKDHYRKLLIEQNSVIQKSLSTLVPFL